MGVDSCIKVYEDLGKQIFPAESIFTKKVGRHGKGLVGVARFDAHVLEDCLKKIIADSPAARGPETKLDFEASRSTGDPKCKVLVSKTRHSSNANRICSWAALFVSRIKTLRNGSGLEHMIRKSQAPSALSGKRAVQPPQLQPSSTTLNSESRSQLDTSMGALV
jgi:hypothetical protein